MSKTKWEINKSSKDDTDLFVSLLETKLERKLTQADFFDLIVKHRHRIALVIMKEEAPGVPA